MRVCMHTYQLCYPQGRDNVLRVASKIVMVEQECGLSSSVEDYQAEFKFGLAEVVYQWALGTVRKFIPQRSHFKDNQKWYWLTGFTFISLSFNFYLLVI